MEKERVLGGGGIRSWLLAYIAFMCDWVRASRWLS